MNARFCIARAARLSFLFFFNDTATTEIYTLSLHDALPICRLYAGAPNADPNGVGDAGAVYVFDRAKDRKSTRLNSSHSQISYAVFCLKKKKASKALKPTSGCRTRPRVSGRLPTTSAGTHGT